MDNAKQIAIMLKQNGYDLSNTNAAIMALQEYLGNSEEEAVSIANFIVEAARGL